MRGTTSTVQSDHNHSRSNTVVQYPNATYGNILAVPQNVIMQQQQQFVPPPNFGQSRVNGPPVNQVNQADIIHQQRMARQLSHRPPNHQRVTQQ